MLKEGSRCFVEKTGQYAEVVSSSSDEGTTRIKWEGHFDWQEVVPTETLRAFNVNAPRPKRNSMPPDAFVPIPQGKGKGKGKGKEIDEKKEKKVIKALPKSRSKAATKTKTTPSKNNKRLTPTPTKVLSNKEKIAKWLKKRESP